MLRGARAGGEAHASSGPDGIMAALYPSPHSRRPHLRCRARAPAMSSSDPVRLLAAHTRRAGSIASSSDTRPSLRHVANAAPPADRAHTSRASPRPPPCRNRRSARRRDPRAPHARAPRSAPSTIAMPSTSPHPFAAMILDDDRHTHTVHARPHIPRLPRSRSSAPRRARQIAQSIRARSRSPAGDLGKRRFRLVIADKRVHTTTQNPSRTSSPWGAAPHE